MMCIYLTVSLIHLSDWVAVNPFLGDAAGSNHWFGMKPMALTGGFTCAYRAYHYSV